ncbi:short-chain dehydrogenase [Aspergillus karnatakaensis]|uniref:short-chain dehydrogenase n=1 Tax=Aspergillus karnatakaensis TaxID=1810916 RepID=UPI003CCDD053
MTTKYPAAHKTLNGPGDARPTALQIIEDEQLKGKWSDKVALITGCSSGIGIETAKAIHATGATVFATARNLEKAKSALGSFLDNDNVHLLELNLESLASVRKAAEEFLSKSNRLDVLITNAGVTSTPEGRTADGFETQLSTNHLAHFLLVQLLLPILQKSTTPQFNSRVVVLSSVAHRDGEVRFDNLNFDGEYDAWAAYAQSKTANLWTSNELERHFGPKGVHSWAVHPGGIVTGLMQHFSEEHMKGLGTDPGLAKLLKSAGQGAATSVWAATAKVLEGKGGKYLEDCQIAAPVKPGVAQFDPGYSAWAYDEEKAARLYEKSIELVQPFLS